MRIQLGWKMLSGLFHGVMKWHKRVVIGLVVKILVTTTTFNLT